MSSVSSAVQFANAPPAMLVSESGSSSAARALQPKNALDSIRFSAPENVTEASFTFPLNAASPIVKSGVSAGRNVTAWSSGHAANAYEPIDSSFVPKLADVSAFAW